MSDFTFDHVSVVIRHGLRTPITAFSDEGRKSIKPIEPSFRCDVSEIFKALQIPIVYRKVNLGSRKHFDGDCHSGQLTAQGVSEEIQLGVYFRNRYSSLFGLSPDHPKIEENQYWIRSTNFERTVESALAVMTGMLGTPPKQPLFIHVLESNFETMYPRRSICDRFRQMIKASVEEDLAKKEWKEYESRITPTMIDAISKSFKASDPQNILKWDWAGFYNTIETYERHGFGIPPALDNKETKDLIKEIAGWSQTPNFRNDSTLRLGIGRFLTEFATNLQTSNKTNKPFRLYSGHDNSLIPLLHVFKIFDGFHPPMGSWMAFEVLNNQKKEKFVRVMYNGKEQSLPQCKDVAKGLKGEYCPMFRFEEIMKPFYINDQQFKQECEVPKTTSTSPSLSNSSDAA